MLRFVLIGGLGYLLACQSPPSEDSTVYSSDADDQSLSTEGNLSGSLTDVVETLKQDAQRIQQLRMIVHQRLDSLYRLENTEDILQEINAYEQTYFNLSEADEAFIDWQNQHPIQHDSLPASTDTAFLNQEQKEIELLVGKLRRNVEQAEDLLEP
jgi:hypothetical protein